MGEHRGGLCERLGHGCQYWIHAALQLYPRKQRQKVKIEMTAPVTTYVTPGAGPSCESTITVSFFVPPEQQADPPKPSENNICIEERAQTTVYVRSFGGFTNAAKNQEQLLQLSESLKRDGKLFDENVYYTAGYDSPFKLFNRHNEILRMTTLENQKKMKTP
ncbi:heme-binding protein 2 isoform X1 [Ascaphus truei]|uniref:heme-binding protein 2 isoform X1 n=1 Tax=Ascaphus truei TaxID=8439 RepID=UPI003F59858A